MEQRVHVQTWRGLCGHQPEQQQQEAKDQKHSEKLEQITDTMERAIDVIMAGYEKLILKAVIPGGIILMIYHLARAGWI
jgi:predicted ATP-grasp superfamily ATP-dependent carboligase